MSQTFDHWLSPRQRLQRNLASVLAIFALLAMILLATVLWWRPWSAERARLAQLVERRDRIQTVLQSRPQLEAALQLAEQAEIAEPLLLPELTREQATAGMMERLLETVNAVGEGGKRCRIDSQSPIAPGTNADAQRVAVNLTLHCGNSEWLQLSQSIESQRPAMFIDKLDVSADAEPTQGVLVISMEVYGFRRHILAAPGAL